MHSMSQVNLLQDKKKKRSYVTLSNSRLPGAAVVCYVYNSIDLSQQLCEVGKNVTLINEETEASGD